MVPGAGAVGEDGQAGAVPGGGDGQGGVGEVDHDLADPAVAAAGCDTVSERVQAGVQGGQVVGVVLRQAVGGPDQTGGGQQHRATGAGHPLGEVPECPGRGRQTGGWTVTSRSGQSSQSPRSSSISHSTPASVRSAGPSQTWQSSFHIARRCRCGCTRE